VSNEAADRLRRWLEWLEREHGSVPGVPDAAWSDALSQWENGIEPPDGRQKDSD
jgi:hypothetical protein